MKKYSILTLLILLSLNSFSQDNKPGGIESGYSDGAGNSSMGPFLLAGREVVSEFYPENNCNEYGTVIIQIVVDRKGNVLDAYPVVSLSNLSECLVKASKEAALKTKWNVAKDAPEKQIGRITYKFKIKQE